MSTYEKKEKGPGRAELREAMIKAMESNDVEKTLRAMMAYILKADKELGIMYSQHIDKWKAKEWVKDQKTLWQQKNEAAKGKRARYEDTTNPLD